MTLRAVGAVVKLLCVAFVVPSLQLIAFGFSYHYAEVLGLPRPAYPTDLRAIASTLYEVVTMRPWQTLIETALTPLLAYALFLAVGITWRGYRRGERLRFVIMGVGGVSVAAGALLIYGYALTFAFASLAGVECGLQVRFATGHDEVSCGSVQHPGPIYVLLRERAQRGLRFQRAFWEANRHGLLRRVAESEGELFLIAVPARSFDATSQRRYAPLWRIAKSDLRLVSEQLPKVAPTPLPSASPR